MWPSTAWLVGVCMACADSWVGRQGVYHITPFAYECTKRELGVGVSSGSRGGVVRESLVARVQLEWSGVQRCSRGVTNGAQGPCRFQFVRWCLVGVFSKFGGLAQRGLSWPALWWVGAKV